MRIVIAGGGIAGLTAALCLRRDGHEVEIVERSAEFGEVGAGLNISPNAVRVLDELGLSQRLDEVGIAPESLHIRRWEDDRVLLDNALADAAADRYGHRSYAVYRPDLIDVLAEAAAGIPVHFGRKVVDASADGSCRLDDDTELAGDLLVGADGVHSTVRTAVFGPETTRFSGYVAYRALVPADAVAQLPNVVTIRVGPDRHLVTYFVGEGRRFLNIVGIVPESTWEVESWTEPGELGDLQAEFGDWSPAVGDILSKVAPPVFRWALHDREELPHWTTPHVALVGDACHPMLPFLGQGACQAIEDGFVLASHIDRAPDLATALSGYEAVRKPRTTDIQNGSWGNRVTYHLPDGPDQQSRDELYATVTADVGLSILDWIYGHDATDD